MLINKVEISDLDQIDKIQQKYFYGFNYYKRNTLLEILNNKNVIFIKIIDQNIIKGYLIAYILVDHIDLYQIATDLQYQNQGIANKLINELYEYKLPILVEVNENNIKAISFYEKQGFKLVRIIKKYYEYSDGYLYKKE